MKKGFTLIEVVIAITIFTVAVGGSFVLVKQSLEAVSRAHSKAIAFYLAQEGIELVRELRDSNWLAQRIGQEISWKNGLAQGEWEMGYNESVLKPYGIGSYLYLGANGFYFYPNPVTTETQTMFKRKIIISEIEGGNALNVRVVVDWQEKGLAIQVETDEILYNWYGSD
jgi:prepilin-type N-terminal cleavage/methylation domain-containing protein